MQNKKPRSRATVKRTTAREKRQVVPASKLDDYLTKQLHRTQGFTTVRLAAGYRLRRADASGCNWSGDVTAIHGIRSPAADVIASAVRPIVGSARARFNLSE